MLWASVLPVRVSVSQHNCRMGGVSNIVRRPPDRKYEYRLVPAAGINPGVTYVASVIITTRS